MATIYWIACMLGNRTALACATCGAGPEDSLPFLQGTLLLSLAPLLFIGTVIYLLYRKFKHVEVQKVNHREE